MNLFTWTIVAVTTVAPPVAVDARTLDGSGEKTAPVTRQAGPAGMDPTMAVAQMLKAGVDVSWLFEPVVAEHIIPREDQLSTAETMRALANVARARQLDRRADVRSALRAVDTIVLAEAAKRSLIDAIRISDADVRARIVASPGRYDEYRLSHIFVAVGTAPDGKTRSDAEARALVQGLRLRLGRGESFEDLAKAVSEDRSTASDGGHLPALIGVSMNEAFFPYVRRLADLGTTEPVRGPEGYHLIRLDQRMPATVASARYWVEQDVIDERLRGDIRKAIAALPTPTAKSDPE